MSWQEFSPVNRRPISKNQSFNRNFGENASLKHARRNPGGTTTVSIDPDVLEYFPDRDSVNNALRGLVSIIKQQRENRPNQPDTYRP